MTAKKAEVIKRVSDEIEDQARTTMYLELKEAKATFQTVALQMGTQSEEELTTIIDYLRGKIERDVVWEECEKFRGRFIDRIVEQWRDKRR